MTSLKHNRPILAAIFVVLALGSCGSGNGVAHIDGSSASVTRPMLDHWMKATVGTDFRANVGTQAPVGLVSEPADYPRCAETVKRVIPNGHIGKLKLSNGQIFMKCRQLYRAIKAQALGYLLSTQGAVLEAEEQGLSVSDAELHEEFERFSREFFGSQTSRQKYLTERHLVLADVLYQLKRNMLVRKLTGRLEVRAKKAGGGVSALVRLALARLRVLTAKTTCETGYVVLGCNEYREPATPLPSPSVILEAFAGAVG